MALVEYTGEITPVKKPAATPNLVPYSGEVTPAPKMQIQAFGAAVPKGQSVLSGTTLPADNAFPAPPPDLYTKNVYDAATPAEREQLVAQSPAYKKVDEYYKAIDQQAAERDQGLGALYKPTISPTLFDTRLENRTAALQEQGLAPDFAAATAKQQALAGAGKMSPYGNVQAAPKSYDIEQEYRLRPEMTGIEETVKVLERAGTKGVLGLGQAAGGVNRFIGDMLGVDTSDTTKLLDEINNYSKAIGQPASKPVAIFEGAVESIAQQFPALIGGVMTGSEPLVLGSMFVNSFGQNYDDSKRLGMDTTDSAMRSTANALLEVVGEKFGLGDQIKGLKAVVNGLPVKDVSTFLAKALAKEIPGEELTYAGQFAVDKGYGLNPEAGIKEFFQGAMDTMAATVAQGGLMLGGGAGATKISQALGRKGEPEALAVPTAAEVMKEQGFVVPPKKEAKLVEYKGEISPTPTKAPEAKVTVEAAPTEVAPVTVEYKGPVAEAPALTEDEQYRADMLAELEGVPAKEATKTPVERAVEPEILAPEDQKDVVIQNRNRATPASINQMNQIAGNPDYDRISFSKDFANGAPVVAGNISLPADRLGTESVVTSADGYKIPVQYGVVEASEILPSNNADGSANSEFMDPNYSGLKAIAGNARTAGIQASYERGTAGQYKASMIEDNLHGINPSVIAGMSNPVLVRVMPQNLVTSNIGDISNVATNLTLSAVEQAKNDANRVDLQGLAFDNNGNITMSALRGFIQAMPISEQANLIDTTGLPTKQAVDRLNAAIFSKAYENEELVRLSYQAEDAEAKLVLKALSEVAPQMSRLEGTGEYDIRPQVAQAAELAVNARRGGIKLDSLVKQQDMTIDPLAQQILQIMADNARSGKRMAEALKDLADRAYEESQGGTEDIFGEKPKRTMAQIVQERPAPEEGLDFSKGYVQGTPAQIEKAKDTVKRKIPSSSIVYQDGDIGLVRGYDKFSGNPMYVPYKNGDVYNLDIKDIGSYGLNSIGYTEEQQKTLLKARDQLEADAQAKHETTPFLTFDYDSQFSPDIPVNLQNVIKEWKELLGLKQKIYFTTLEHATEIKDQFTGPHRMIGSASANREEGGFTSALKDGNRVVVFKKNASLSKNLEIIGHELGHAHMYEVYVNAPQEIKDELEKEHLKWAKTIKGDTFAKDLVNSLRARKTAKTTGMVEGLTAKDLKGVDTYWRSFKEWYADQTSKWATTNEKPLNAVEKFFSRLGKALKSFYSKGKNAGYLPTETFKQYMDSQVAKLDLEPITEKQIQPEISDQMVLFSESKVEAEEKKPKLKTLYKNYKGGPAPLSEWESPEVNQKESLIDSFLYRMQDKFIDTKRVQQAITQQVGEIEDKYNAYNKESLSHEKTAKQTQDFLTNELLPIIKEMDKNGITIQEFGGDKGYLHNRHAQERNKQIATINPELQDGGSGIDNADAQAYMDNLDPAKKKIMESLAKKVDAIIKDTQRILVESGLETQETIDTWNKTYKQYMPLFREGLEFSAAKKGKGTGVGTRGPSTRRAMGSTKEISEILSNVAEFRESAIMRAERAIVGRAIYGLAIKNPNTNFWLAVNPDAAKNKKKLEAELVSMGMSPEDAKNFIQEPQQPYIDPKTGLVAYRVNPALRNSDNVLPIRVNGQDRYVFFNPNDEQAMRMVSALKNLDTKGFNAFFNAIGMGTRWIASVNTQYNPVFGMWNFTRDVQGAALNVTSTELAGHEKEILSYTLPALKGIYQDIRSQSKGKGPVDSEWSRLWEDFQQAGGPTGYRDQFAKARRQATIIEREMKNLNQGNAMKVAKAVAQWLSDYNDSMENAVRLAAYKVGLEQGMSRDKAAILAKNLTVNFNRKGSLAQDIGVLYAFFNASVQGSARLIETLKGPAGRKIIAGGLLLGTMQAVVLAMAGFDDDDPPEFVKARNLIIPTGGGTYVMIPMPLGYNIIPTTGRLLTEMVLSGGKNVSTKLFDWMGALADSFNPIGGSGLQLIAPTVLDPFVALKTNKDAFGRPIYREDRTTAPTPGYTRSRESASTFSKYLSEFLNYVSSGGMKYTKGAISPTADEIDYLAGQVTGGVGREIMKAGQTIGNLFTGEETAPYKRPIISKLVGDTEAPSNISNKFYQNIIDMANHEAEIKGRIKNRENAEEYRQDNPEARLWQRANNVENQINKLNKEKRDLAKKDGQEDRIKRIDEKKTKLMQDFNERVKSAQE